MRRYPNLLLFAAIIACSATFAHGADYSVSLIAAGPAQTTTYAGSINNSGQITGYFQARTPHVIYGFIYENGTVFDMSTLGYLDSYVTGINNSGTATGYFITFDSPERYAFLYSQEGGLIVLGSLGGGSASLGISAAGHVTGYSYSADYSTYHAFLYSNGTMKDLGTLGGITSTGKAVNANGQVVGESWLADGQTIHAFLSSNGIMTDLGTLGGPFSGATAINDAGQITGYADRADFVQYSNIASRYARHAYLYDNGEMIDLGTLGGAFSIGMAINNLGQVVGSSNPTPLEYNTHAFLYTDDRMIDLNMLIDPDSGWILLEATGINDAGQIVGNGYFNGIPHAFLLTPTDGRYDLSSVPEPATLPILALAALALIRRRRA